MRQFFSNLKAVKAEVLLKCYHKPLLSCCFFFFVFFFLQLILVLLIWIIDGHGFPALSASADGRRTDISISFLSYLFLSPPPQDIDVASIEPIQSFLSLYIYYYIIEEEGCQRR